MLKAQGMGWETPNPNPRIHKGTEGQTLPYMERDSQPLDEDLTTQSC